MQLKLNGYDEKRDGTSHTKFTEPPFGPIIGSILGIVGWLVFIVLFALYWSKGFDLFQNIIVTIASLLVMGLLIGALWMVWFRLSGEPRGWWQSAGRDQATETPRHRRRNANEVLDPGQRSGEVASVFIAILVLAFFTYHQVANTGFFTSRFGDLEMFAFYGSIVLSLAPPIARAVVGRRNPVRPLEAASNLFFAFASLYLLTIFPFNFAHLSDALPPAIRFVLLWVTNDIAKILFAIAFLGSLISAAVNAIRYIIFNPSTDSAEWIEKAGAGGEESRPPATT